MKMEQVSTHCYSVLNEKNLVCDANSGLINLGGGVVIDTQSDLAHGRQMIELFGKVWRAMPKRVINTHEDGDHVWGNQLFEGAEIIAHRTVKDLMPQVADPKETQQLIKGSDRFLTRMLLKALHPGALAIAGQLKQDYDFDGIRLVLPTTVFEERHVLDLDGTEVHLIYVGPCHQIGDTIIHVPKEKVVFAGDVIFRECTPMGWNGTYEKWIVREVDRGPRSHHRARPGRHRSRTRAGVRDRGRDGDEGLPRIRARGVQALLRPGAERPGGLEEDRLRPVRRLARPGAPVHERRAGLP